MPKKSYAQDLINQCIDLAANNTGKMEKEAAERRKMVENSRKSNFNIGEESKKKNELYATQTSSNQAYQKVQIAKSATEFSRMDFKVANFKLGSNLPKYVTTSKDTYQYDQKMRDRSKEISEDNKDKVQRLQAMKQQQFVIGKDQPQFLTEAQKKFVRHDIQGCSSQESHKKGL
jgi:hypothetical protein